MTATVCVPLTFERLALRGALPGCRVVRTGMGPRRARAAGAAAGLARSGAIVAGVAGGLDPRVRPGDIVVATEVRAGAAVTPVPSAPLLAGAVRRLGLPVHTGPVICTTTVAGGPALARLAATGALAVEMEAAALAEAAGGAPFAVVRAVLDTTAHPLLRPGTPARALRALANLRRVAPAVRQWAAATGERQVVLASARSSVRVVAGQVDLVLVVGSTDSSNSLRLVEVAARAGAAAAHLVQDAGDVDLGWLAGARRVGITAGASTPPQLVDGLLGCLAGLGPVTLREPRAVG